MATVNISTASETKEWVLACNEFEMCEVESLSIDVSFIESELMPTTEIEQNNMHFLQFVPRDFTGNGIDKLWVFIDSKSKFRKRPSINKVLPQESITQRYFTYDDEGRIKEEIIVYECRAIVRTYTYDINGKLISIVDNDFPLVSCADSVGGSDGTEYNLNNTWAINCPMFKE